MKTPYVPCIKQTLGVPEGVERGGSSGKMKGWVGGSPKSRSYIFSGLDLEWFFSPLSCMTALSRSKTLNPFSTLFHTINTYSTIMTGYPEPDPDNVSWHAKPGEVIPHRDQDLGLSAIVCTHVRDDCQDLGGGFVFYCLNLRPEMTGTVIMLLRAEQLLHGTLPCRDGARGMRVGIALCNKAGDLSRLETYVNLNPKP
jgi:hypothetical protein